MDDLPPGIPVASAADGTEAVPPVASTRGTRHNGFCNCLYYNGEDVGEVDFLVEKDSKALPLEVKSGRHYRTHAALDGLLKKNGADIPLAVVFSNANCSRQGKISYQPLYQAMFLDHDGLPSDAVYELPSLDVHPRTR